MITKDIMRFIKFFENYGTIATGCNSSFITLVSKCKDSISLSDYMPINLIGCMSKIISKTLAMRLKTVMESIIDDVQSTCSEGRNILEGPFIMSELFSCAKR